MQDLYMLKPESQKIVINRLTDMAKKDETTVHAFYFLYGIGKLLDNVQNGEELYDYFQNKSTEFMYMKQDKFIEYVKKTESNSDLFGIGKRLATTMSEKEVGAIFYNGNHRDELVKIFNEELF